MKPVLMVAYLYPPGAGSSGVLRPLKFSRFLPDHGWQPHVLTVREWLYEITDPTLFAEVPPEVVVHRTMALDSTRHLAIRRRSLRALAVPDPYVAWIPFGVARGLRIIRSAGIKAIYSTSPPATSHLIAALLHRATGLPWIADFRDPWIEEGLHPRPGTLRFRVESALEAWVVRTANRLTVTTGYLGGDFIRRYPDLAPERVQVLTNGFDEDDFAGIEARPDPKRFEVIHAGYVTPEFRDPRPLLRAVSALVKDGRLPRASVRVTLLGLGPWVLSREFQESVQTLGLQDVVSLEPFVPHRAALERLASASLLLLLQAGDDLRSMIPAKAFEYLRLGLPVLALVHEGATADLLKGFDGCRIVQPEDEAGIREALLAAHDAWRRGGPPRRTLRGLEIYERRQITAGLARALDELTERNITRR